MNILKTILSVIIPEIVTAKNKKRSIPKIVGNITNGVTMVTLVSIPDDLFNALIDKNPLYALLGIILVGALNVIPYVVSARYTEHSEDNPNA